MKRPTHRPHTRREIHAAATAAVERALFPIAADVARLMRGGRFDRVMLAREAGGR